MDSLHRVSKSSLVLSAVIFVALVGTFGLTFYAFLTSTTGSHNTVASAAGSFGIYENTFQPTRIQQNGNVTPGFTKNYVFETDVKGSFDVIDTKAKIPIWQVIPSPANVKFGSVNGGVYTTYQNVDNRIVILATGTYNNSTQDIYQLVQNVDGTWGQWTDLGGPLKTHYSTQNIIIQGDSNGLMHFFINDNAGNTTGSIWGRTENTTPNNKTPITWGPWIKYGYPTNVGLSYFNATQYLGHINVIAIGYDVKSGTGAVWIKDIESTTAKWQEIGTPPLETNITAIKPNAAGGTGDSLAHVYSGLNSQANLEIVIETNNGKIWNIQKQNTGWGPWVGVGDLEEGVGLSLGVYNNALAVVGVDGNQGILKMGYQNTDNVTWTNLLNNARPGVSYIYDAYTSFDATYGNSTFTLSAYVVGSDGNLWKTNPHVSNPLIRMPISYTNLGHPVSVALAP